MINKKNLIERLEYASKWNTPVSRWIIDLIRNMPETVIRCERCQHYEMRDNHSYCNFLEMYVAENDFCSRGKAKWGQ